MDEAERLNKIRNREKSGSGISGLTGEDVRFLLDLIDTKAARIQLLEKKSNVLTDQLAELSQEIENTKSDFGSQR